MKFFSSHKIVYTKPQRWAMLVLLLLIFGIELLNFGLSQRSKNEIEKIEIPKEILAFSEELKTKTKNEIYPKTGLSEFDPNHLSAEDWRNLGFSEKQVQTILKYKYSLGGNFKNKGEIQNCFVISDEKFQELEPYIKIGKISSKPKFSSNSYFERESKPEINYVSFDPNQYSEKDWMKIGFSEKQAATILKYKRSLGGKFKSLDEIQKCFVISPEKFLEMKPYIRIAKVEANTSNTQHLASNKTEKFNPNQLSREQWMDLGFTEKQVNTIFNFKRSLGGKFKDAATLKKCYSISEEKFKEIEPYLDFNLD